MKTRYCKSCWPAFLFAFTLGLVSAGAQEKRPAATTHHTLWKVHGKTNSVYLLGSVHVLKEEDYPLPTVIETAFTNARVAAFETDVEALEDPALAMKLLAKARLPEGQTLHEQLTPETYKKFTNHIGGAGLPIEMFDQFTPAMAAMTLVVLEIQKLGLDPKYGVDKHFYHLAKESGKEIVPLETVDFQIGLLTDFSKEEGELLMKTTLKDMETMKTEFGTLVKAWHTGDAAKLSKLLNEASQEAPSLYKRLLIDRNRNWVPKIEEMVKGGRDAIVIVGAGHLVGKDGVVEMLRSKGLKVTQE